MLSKKQQSVLSQIWFFTAPCTVAPQAPLSIEVSRQKHWNRLSFPLPGDLPDPGIKQLSCVSCIGRWILYLCATWEAQETAISGRLKYKRGRLPKDLSDSLPKFPFQVSVVGSGRRRGRIGQHEAWIQGKVSWPEGCGGEPAPAVSLSGNRTLR